MVDRWTNRRHERLRSLRLQRVVASDQTDVGRTPSVVDGPSGCDTVEEFPAAYTESVPAWTGQIPRLESATAPAVHPAQVAAEWSPSRLADPVGSARRVHNQLQHSGGAAVRMHAPLEGVHELIGGD